jgi:hypothetical protein
VFELSSIIKYGILYWLCIIQMEIYFLYKNFKFVVNGLFF